MNYIVKDKVALVSGAASGIGAATAKRLIEQGAAVALGDLDSEKGQELADTLGANALFVSLDVRDESAWLNAIQSTQDTFGQLTTLVNSAGISIPSDIESTSLEEFRHMLSINLEGTFLGCQAAINSMRHVEGGSIVNISSTMARRGNGSLFSYCASKGGVHTMTRAIALHCADKGYDIRVNSVAPGAIHTEMVDGYVQMAVDMGGSGDDVIASFASTAPLQRLGNADEVASAIVYLASDEATYCTGTELVVDGGFLA